MADSGLCLGRIVRCHRAIRLHDTFCRTATWMTAVANTQLVCHALIEEKWFAFGGKWIVNSASLPLSRQLAVRGWSPRTKLARAQEMSIGIGQIFIKSPIVFLITPVIA